MARKLPVSDFGRAHMNAQQVGHLPAPVLAPGAWPAFGPSPAQTGHELTLELASGLDIDDIINGFVRLA